MRIVWPGRWAIDVPPEAVVWDERFTGPEKLKVRWPTGLVIYRMKSPEQTRSPMDPWWGRAE